ncbi:low molecular weight protein-tyrosine-phosphatase [Thermodesulfobacteriota bacterium]
MNILFVCTGNISRSFLAAALLRDAVSQLHLRNISVASAGIAAYEGNPADNKMVEYLEEKGITPVDHAARQIQKEDVDWADQILVMENEHAMKISGFWPESADKIEMLGKYLTKGPIPDDVVDPYRRSPYHYRLAQAQITMAVQALIKELTQEQ